MTPNPQKQPQPLLFTRTGRPDASMTLLTEVMEQPLDPSYAAVAHRRVANPHPTAPVANWSRRISVLMAALILGAGTAIAAVHLHDPTGGARETRLLLESQIQSRTDSIANTTQVITDISADITTLQQAVLTNTDPVLAAQLQIDELHNGRTPLSGPGMVITLTDGGGGLTEVTSDHLVRDVDLQHVVSALWAAGAEAIAIGDQRLTMTTAIRNAGNAVLVDLIPVLGPTYQVIAIGNPDFLEAGWIVSEAPAYLAMLGTEFGIRATAHIYPSVSVPNATPPVLRFAEPLESAAVTPTFAAAP